MSRARLLAPIAWMGVIWFLSSLTSAAEGELAGFTIPPFIQNGGHAVLYAILAAAWFWALRTDNPSTPRLVAMLSLGYGVIDELHQSFVPGRTCSFLDVCVDGLGIALVILIVRNRQAQRASALSDTPISR